MGQNKEHISMKDKVVWYNGFACRHLHNNTRQARISILASDDLDLQMDFGFGARISLQGRKKT